MSLDFRFSVSDDEDGQMLKTILQRRYRFSRRMLRQLKLASAVTVNGRSIYFTSRVAAGDDVMIRLSENVDMRFEPEDIPLNVLHEDREIIVLNKQPGIVVHPTRRYPNGTIANGLLHYWKQRGERYVIRPVNRLDKETTGVIVFAKHAYAHHALSKQLQSNVFQREYRAIVAGNMQSERGTINLPIERDPERPSHRMVTPKGKQAITRYTVLKSFEMMTYISCELQSGRTHQIRVHMQAIGHPIIGDTMYGDESINERFNVSRQALHAYSIRFVHPRTKKRVEFTAPLPTDMALLLGMSR